MISEEPHHRGCVVIVTVDGPSDVIGQLIDHASAGIEEHFQRFAGYIDGTLHLSADATRIVQVLRWTDEASYLACRDDPLWETLDSTETFARALSEAHVSMDARTYDVIARSSLPSFPEHG